MAAAKEIRSQIGSIKNTQKITSAMEMVAASKMRKAQDRMRPASLCQADPQGRGSPRQGNPEYKHPWMEEREVKRVGFIVVSSDRGLCGGLNVNLFKSVVKEAKAGMTRGQSLISARLAARRARSSASTAETSWRPRAGWARRPGPRI